MRELGVIEITKLGSLHEAKLKKTTKKFIKKQK